MEFAVRTQQSNQVLRESARASPDTRLLMQMENMMEKLTATRKQLEVALG
ncbi:hypothetical protein ALQ08_02287 [Pseudomonas syringae pv. delphinii]|uniref:Uncharacterized protein n=1 Tax=Pseudomonas syringae pv. delphinii TaxID=192088 RepID=A0A0P9PJV2_9PSED|nr:Unknown protein sequence [Pseudomonas syringae pv. delphinii]RMP28059.1 hypothetical protein ALQ27_01824 [Pseudomonas syringae pv. delphinii]RMQ27241.1 hypothetical protein ALQ08_02287 [Pseudomonas syringae pv. delphinii]